MDSQLISFKELENSKRYIHKSDALTFKHPMDYVQPFLDVMDRSGIPITWDVKVETGSSNAERDSGDKNIAYSRVAVIARLPSEYDINPNDPIFNHLQSEIGLVYALDSTKPEIKAFRGSRVSVCTNQCVFGTTDVKVFSLTSNYQELYGYLDNFAEQTATTFTRYKDIIDHMANRVLRGDEYLAKIGELAQYGLSERKLGSNMVTDAIRNTLNPKSMYYVPENTATVWKLYNACTAEFVKSSIVDEPAKSLLLRNLFLDNVNYN